MRDAFEEGVCLGLFWFIIVFLSFLAGFVAGINCDLSYKSVLEQIGKGIGISSLMLLACALIGFAESLKKERGALK